MTVDTSFQIQASEGSASRYPALSVIIPTLNEEASIEQCLRSLAPQIRPTMDEVIVLDGGSADRTCEIVRKLQAEYPFIRLAFNPKRLQSAAVNLGAKIAASTSQIIIRADAHAEYPQDYIELCATSLIETGADSVVVPMYAEGKNAFQRAAAAAQNSRIGNGGSAHRRGGGSRYVEHGHHAAFNRATFLALKGYNEEFTHNEDAEFDHRLTSSGGRIWMCSEARITYFPRSSIRSLARQYYNHGGGRARTLLLHQKVPRLRQVLPPLIVMSIAGSLVLSFFHPIMLLVSGAYAAGLAGASILHAVQSRDRALLAVGPASGVMHLSWGCGFLVALFGWVPTLFRSSRRSIPA